MFHVRLVMPCVQGQAFAPASATRITAASWACNGASPRYRDVNDTCCTQAYVDGSLFPLPHHPADRHPAGLFTDGAGADSMNSFPSSIFQKRRCTVPFHASFHDISTVIMNALSSTRYLPL